MSRFNHTGIPNSMVDDLFAVSDVEGNPTGGNTNRIKIMSSDLVDILEGFLWEMWYKETYTNGQKKFICFKTPSDRRVWVRPMVMSPTADNVTISLLEGVTYTGGTAITTNFNHNRLVTRPSPITDCVVVDTLLTQGTIINQLFLGGGTGVGHTATGSGASESSEFILKPNTFYAVEIHNGSSHANNIQFNVVYFDE